MKDQKLNELANDFFNFMYGKPKKKKLKPLIKQLTYKGITKKWSYNGSSLHIVNGKNYEWCFLEKDFNLSIEEKELIECYIIELETILKLSK